MRDNPLTTSMAKMSDYLLRVDKKYKEMGKMPFGMVKATLKEQKEAFEKLTEQDMFNLIDNYGEEAVNNYIRRMMQNAT